MTKFPFVTRNLDLIGANLESRIPRNPRINPLKIYWVDPDKIRFCLSSNFPGFNSIFLSPVLGGEWDRNVEELKYYDIIYSLDKHFSKDLEWEKTDIYLRGKNAVESDLKWEGRGEYDNLEEFEQYLERIDHVYSLIKSEGFRSQKELNKEGLDSRVLSHRAIGMDEVTVNIGRDGRLIHDDGWHRLAIAKSLNLNKIPVRVKVRHREWQKKRKKSLEKDKPVVQNHPDLKNLFEGSS